MFFALKVVTDVSSTVGPTFFTLSVLHIVEPFAHVFSIVCMEIGTMTVSLVIYPITFIGVAIGMK